MCETGGGCGFKGRKKKGARNFLVLCRKKIWASFFSSSFVDKEKLTRKRLNIYGFFEGYEDE